MSDELKTMAQMNWQERVRQEHADLVKKTEALQAFLQDDSKAGALPFEDVVVLSDQYAVMQRYAEILSDRISRF